MFGYYGGVGGGGGPISATESRIYDKVWRNFFWICMLIRCFTQLPLSTVLDFQKGFLRRTIQIVESAAKVLMCEHFTNIVLQLGVKTKNMGERHKPLNEREIRWKTSKSSLRIIKYQFSPNKTRGFIIDSKVPVFHIVEEFPPPQEWFEHET